MAADVGDFPGVGDGRAVQAVLPSSKAQSQSCGGASNTLKPAPNKRGTAIFSNPSETHGTAKPCTQGPVSENQSVIANQSVQKASVIANANTLEIEGKSEAHQRAIEARGRLKDLQEEFRWSPGHEDWRGRWWHGLRANEKQLLCALVGVDDSEASVKRSWMSLPRSMRETISKECRHWARLLEAMRWA